MLMADFEKMVVRIRGTRTKNMIEFAYLTIALINRYGKESVQKAFELGCDEKFDERFQEDNRNDKIKRK